MIDENEDALDFNFWPSFSDLMLSLVLVLVLVLYLVAAVITRGTVDLQHVENKQKIMGEKLAHEYETKLHPVLGEENFFSFSTVLGGRPDIFIKNEPGMQRIMFSDKILFDTNKYELSLNGQWVLERVGRILQEQVESQAIREIQIQGHADPDLAYDYRTFGPDNGNLELAAFRAMRVFLFFQNDVHIDPTRILMSGTTFSSYKPVLRNDEDPNWSEQRIQKENQTDEQKARNRRIEILLFYRLSNVK